MDSLGYKGECNFNLITSLALSNYGGINPTNIYVSPVDIPAITDVDYDGDNVTDDMDDCPLSNKVGPTKYPFSYP